MKSLSFIHFSLRRKIYLSFSLLVLLFVINGIITIVTLQKNKKLADNISEVIDPALQSLGDLRQMVLESKMYTTNWVFLRSKQEDKDLLVQMHQSHYLALKAQLNTYSSQWNSNYMNDSLHGVYIGFEKLLLIEKNIMESLQKFEDYDDLVIRIEAERKIEDEVLPRTDALMRSLGNITVYGERVRLQEHVRLEQSSLELRTFIIVLAITIICMGLLLSIYMMRVIIGPVNKIKSIVNDLGKGIIRQSEHITQKDEIGEMMQAVNNLSEKTLATTQFAHEVGLRNFQIPFQPLSDDDFLGKALITMRDNLRISEIQMVEAKEKAESASMAKSEFMANMSHELRTPMNGIIGFAELVLTTELNKTQREYIGNVNKSAYNLLNIINDILDFSKIEAGKLIIDYTTFRLNEVMEETADMLAIRAQEKGVEIICQIDPILPAQFFGDAVRIRQILINLIGNAIKFTDKGEIFVTVKQGVTHVKQGRKMMDVSISVKDTGIGIDKDKVERIFESFTQADSSTTRKFGGTGLGLTISKSLAELMEGNLAVESEPGAGSTFTLNLGLQIIDEAPRVSMTSKGLLREVLVIDDNVTNCQLMQGIFEYLNIPCKICFNGPDALKMIEKSVADKQLFDLIITDHQMPGMDGITLVREIKKLLSGSSEPFILMLSSLEKTMFQQEAEKVGIDKFLSKPVKLNELVNLLSFLFEKSYLKKDANVTIPKLARFSGRIEVLVAEDNDMNMALITEVLTNMQLQVIPAGNGKEALQQLEKYNPALIFMDVNMPVMDGFETTSLIRQLSGPKKDIPIIALTADAMKEDRERCLQVGMNDFLSKPFRLKEIESVLKTYLGDANPENNSLSIVTPLFTPDIKISV